MDMIVWIVIITAIAGVGGTGLGGLMSAAIKRESDRIVSLLLSFAGGIMLSVVCFDLLREAMFPDGVGGTRFLPLALGGTLVGYGVVGLLNYFIDKSTNHEITHIDDEHPRTADSLEELIHSDHYMEHKKSNSQLFIAGVIMACAIALHNLPEGMVIGAAFAVGDGAYTAGSGFVLAIVIGLHNIPEGMSIAVPLIAGGMGRFKAVLITAASGLPTVLGALLGYWMGALGETSLSLALSFASGAMLYVVFGELLPESILMWRSKLPALMTMVGMLIGIVVIFV